jgi:uncharacterized protein
MTRPPRPGDLLAIDADECVRLLESAAWVRLGFVLDGVPSILPINVLLHDQDIFFRTATGSKLAAAAASGPVAVQADDGDPTKRVGWSVLAHGQASILTDPAVEEALHAKPFEPWAIPDDKPFWVRVEVSDITGRRITRP